MWVDANSACNAIGVGVEEPMDVFAPGKMGMFLERMGKVMISTRKYTLTKEVQGFAAKGMTEYGGFSSGSDFTLTGGA